MSALLTWEPSAGQNPAQELHWHSHVLVCSDVTQNPCFLHSLLRLTPAGLYVSAVWKVKLVAFTLVHSNPTGLYVTMQLWGNSKPATGSNHLPLLGFPHGGQTEELS